MALKPCKECGNQISDKAESCPQCGAKQKRKTSKLVLFIAGFFLFCVFVAIIGESDFANKNTSAESGNEPTERQKWFIETDVDPMTDKKRVYVSLVANDVIMNGNDWATIQEPVITFRCEDNATDFIIDFKQPLSAEYGNALRRTTQFRIDDKPSSKVTLNTSQGDLKIYFVSNPVATMKKMMNGDELKISYQAHRIGEQVLTFNIKEFSEKIKPVREACNW